MSASHHSHVDEDTQPLFGNMEDEDSKSMTENNTQLFNEPESPKTSWRSNSLAHSHSSVNSNINALMDTDINAHSDIRTDMNNHNHHPHSNNNDNNNNTKLHNVQHDTVMMQYPEPTLSQRPSRQFLPSKIFGLSMDPSRSRSRSPSRISANRFFNFKNPSISNMSHSSGSSISQKYGAKSRKPMSGQDVRNLWSSQHHQIDPDPWIPSDKAEGHVKTGIDWDFLANNSEIPLSPLKYTKSSETLKNNNINNGLGFMVKKI